MVADLDKDGDSDLLTISARDVSCRLHLGSRFGTAQRIYAIPSGRDGGSVAGGDADGDADLDVYAMTAASGSNPPDVILLNNGNLTFTTLAAPSATGAADEVIEV